MTIFLGFIISYILSGIFIGYTTEMFVLLLMNHIYSATELRDLDMRGPIESRLKEYNIIWFLMDVKLILRWPYELARTYTSIINAVCDDDAKAKFIDLIRKEESE